MKKGKSNFVFILLLLSAGTTEINGHVRFAPLESPQEGCGYSDLKLPLPPSVSTLHQFKRGVVCSDSRECSKIGSDIFEKGGNVVDATIATMLCNGITTAQSMGIGGGFLMNIWLHDDKKSITLNAKEVAPLTATKDMFKTPEEYADGPLAIAVPGEVKGYWELHKKYGSMPWKSLVEPSVEVCVNGFKLSQHMSDFITLRIVADSPLRRSFFINGTNIPHQPGDLIYLPSELCNTYKLLGENGGDDFYTGTLADSIADDLRDLGSIITKKDLQSYEVRWEESLSLPISDDDIVHTTPSAGGPILAFGLNVLRGYNFTPKSIENDDESLRTHHRIIEAFKFAFGFRTQMNNSVSSENNVALIRHMLSPELAEQIRRKISDKQTVNDVKYYGGQFEVVNDQGTSHFSVLAPNGDAISVTSSINFYFGIGQSGRRTGIIFNSGMNDFSVPAMKNLGGLPASPGNYIEPQKRAQSSMSPTIVTDMSGKVRLIVGAAGGPKIPTAVLMIIARMIWFNQNIKEAVDQPRVHHQLIPMEVQYECGNTKKLITGLEFLGHKTSLYSGRGSVVCAIAQNRTGIFANADYRKSGDVAGF